MSGVLLALSFPKFGTPFLAWVALVPLLVALHRQTLLRATLLGLLTGVVYFSGTLYWITRVMVVYGGLSTPVGIGVNAALIAYMALYPAIFAAVVARLTMAIGVRGLLAAPLVWVATELGRGQLFTGFPWVLLGYSQTPVLPVAQLASLLGVYGISALIVLLNATLAMFALSPQRQRRAAYGPLALAIVLTAGVVMWGGWRIADGQLTTAGTPIRVAMIQGNVPLEEKWDDRRSPQVFRRYMTRSREAVAQGARFILWPESATPFMFAENLGAADEVRALARDSGVSVLLGSDQIERGNPNRYFNAAYLIGAQGQTAAVYRKIHLVPFGEYVPLRKVFFFAESLVEAVSDFTPGTAATLLPVQGHMVSTAICYEVVYPNLVGTFVRGGSELLTTITNDAWFGPTSAPYQHFAQASMRAIENGRYLVRAANTGISGVVDPYGRVVARSGLFEEATLINEVRFLTSTTLYARTGDVFAYGCTVAVAALLVMARRSYRMTRHS